MLGFKKILDFEKILDFGKTLDSRKITGFVNVIFANNYLL